MPALERTSRFRHILDVVHAAVMRWLASPRFFLAIVSLLVFQALWIALSAVYPQAFDENVHFGLIQLHAQQWLPYFTAHIPGAEIYGAISRDPSYLYHFMMSLPYRAVSAVIDSLAAQVIALRLINIAMFAGGLFVYRKVLTELGISRRMMHVVLLFFVLTPIMPLLASQINYDNLIFLLTGLLFLAALRFWHTLQEQQRIDAGVLLQIILYGLIAAIVKYTSLPLTVGVWAVLGWTIFLAYRRGQLRFPDGLRWPRRPLLVMYGLVVIVIGFLFVERIGLNVIRHGSPSPDCAKVLTVEQCMSFSPWGRDHLFSQTYPEPSTWGKIVYPFVWVHRMVWETMFIISSTFQDGSQRVRYIATPPLTVANYTAWTIVVAGTVLLAVFFRRLWAMRPLRYFLLAIALYCTALFLKNLAMYLHAGEAVAIHGRYLIPMYPVLYAALALGFSWGLDRVGRPRFKVWLTLLTLVLLVHGAGLIGWIYRSTPQWYWPPETAPPVIRINQTAQDVLHRVIIP